MAVPEKLKGLPDCMSYSNSFNNCNIRFSAMRNIIPYIATVLLPIVIGRFSGPKLLTAC